MATMKLLVFPLLLVALAGCAPRTPRPQLLPSYSQHSYVITASDEAGGPIEGVRFQVTSADWATYLTRDGGLLRNSTRAITETDGKAVSAVSVSLAQHWPTYYKKPMVEAALAKYPRAHGARDIWGYLTEFEVSGPQAQSRALFTVDAAPATESISFVYKVPGQWRMPGSHEYRYIAVDKVGTAVVGATIVAQVADHSIIKGDRQRLTPSRTSLQCTTNEQGLCSVLVPVRMYPHYKSDYAGEPISHAFSRLQATDDHDGYFGYLSSAVAYGAAGSFFRSNEQTSFQSSLTDAEPAVADPIKINVPVPRDYYCDALKSPDQLQFAGTLDVWTKAIKVRGDWRKVGLRTICRETFKGKQYISLSFLHEVRYNELRLNNYGIGALIFDEVVRKLLDPIASASTSLPIDGYKLTIRTQKSNFVDKSDAGEFLTYDFYLPKALVRQYKDADISGQKLITGSIILLDDERIDLELK